MHDRNSLPDASPLVRRQGKRAWEFRYILQEIVFRAKGAEDMKRLLKEELYSKPEYQDLPKFRVIGLSDYLAGLLDSIARIRGIDAPEISLELPKARPVSRLSEKIEDLRTGRASSTATTRALPVWAVEGPPAVKAGRAILDKMIAEADVQESGVVARPAVEIRRRPVSEIQAVKPDARAGTLPPPAQSEAPPDHRVVGGARRTFRRRRLR